MTGSIKYVSLWRQREESERQSEIIPDYSRIPDWTPLMVWDLSITPQVGTSRTGLIGQNIYRLCIMILICVSVYLSVNSYV